MIQYTHLGADGIEMGEVEQNPSWNKKTLEVFKRKAALKAFQPNRWNKIYDFLNKPVIAGIYLVLFISTFTVAVFFGERLNAALGLSKDEGEALRIAAALIVLVPYGLQVLAQRAKAWPPQWVSTSSIVDFWKTYGGFHIQPDCLEYMKRQAEEGLIMGLYGPALSVECLVHARRGFGRCPYYMILYLDSLRGERRVLAVLDVDNRKMLNLDLLLV